MHINSNALQTVILLSVIWIMPPAQAALNVFACEPEYAALAQELAPDANVYSATTALQDPHQIQARPSLIAQMRRADLVICAGAELEVGWLPMLQQKAANPAVQPGQPGLFYAAEQVETLDKPTRIDATMGDVHAGGNPHVHLDPHRLLQIAQALTVRLKQLEPAKTAFYQQQFDHFAQRWQQSIARWQQLAKPLHGKQVIGYHSSFRYLYHWLGIRQVADLEPKPGLPPSSSHLATLLSRAKQGDIDAIITASYQDQTGANWLANKTNLPRAVLPISVSGDKQSQNLFALYDSLITRLIKVLQ